MSRDTVQLSTLKIGDRFRTTRGPILEHVVIDKSDYIRAEDETGAVAYFNVFEMVEVVD